jgi:hypothetical protein
VSTPQPRQNGTYVLVALNAQIAGYGASRAVPKAAVMCGREVKLGDVRADQSFVG